jgi:hypothetical protein
LCNFEDGFVWQKAPLRLPFGATQPLSKKGLWSAGAPRPRANASVAAISILRTWRSSRQSSAPFEFQRSDLVGFGRIVLFFGLIQSD